MNLLKNKIKKAQNRMRVNEAFMRLKFRVTKLSPSQKITLADEYFFKGSCAGLLQLPAMGFIPDKYITDSAKSIVSSGAKHSYVNPENYLKDVH